MADWRDIGIGNYRAAVTLVEAKQYRSAVSRFYYAVFSLVTQELIDRGAAPDFHGGQATPSHRQVPALAERYFTHFSEERGRNFTLTIARLYTDRLNADYSDNRVNRDAANASFERAKTAFRYLRVNHERK